MGFLWGILVCALVGFIAWRYGQHKAKYDVENQAITLLSKIAELIKEEKPEQARKIIKKFTSGEKKIRDIIVLENLS
jgi:predicted negative regulator of RcsB-dependent stress response